MIESKDSLIRGNTMNGMKLLEKRAREYSKANFPGLPAKEKTILDRETISYMIKHECSMGVAFREVVTSKKDYYDVLCVGSDT